MKDSLVMERPKRWQLILIVAVILLTLYNILPTIFYYSKPLNESIGKTQADTVASQMLQRVENLEQDAIAWIQAYSKHLGLKPKEIALQQDPQFIQVRFSNDHDTAVFKQYLSEAGVRIPFVPAQLKLVPNLDSEALNTVIVQRQIGVQLPTTSLDQYFTFAYKREADGELTPFYRKLVQERQEQLALQLGGVSANYLKLSSLLELEGNKAEDHTRGMLQLAAQVNEVRTVFGQSSATAKRFFSSFTQGPDLSSEAKSQLISSWISQLSALKENAESAEAALVQQEIQKKEEGKFLTAEEQQQLRQIKEQNEILSQALRVVKSEKAVFASGQKPLRFSKEEQLPLTIMIGKNNPFVQSVEFEPNQEQLKIYFHEDLVPGQEKENNQEYYDFLEGKIKSMLVNEVAGISQTLEETLKPQGKSAYAISLSELTDSKSLLALDLSKFAQARVNPIIDHIKANWQPKHIDFQTDVFPIMNYEAYSNLPPEEQKLGIYFYAPVTENVENEPYFRPQSIYVVAKGLHSILEKYDAYPESEETEVFLKDFYRLNDLLQQFGFFGYPAANYGFPKDYRKDYVFELHDYYSPYLKATREDFVVKGAQRYAVLEFTDVEQRIMTTNKIKRSIHEDLLKWRDDYYSAEVSRNPIEKFLVPPVTKNIWWQNIKLNAYKYFNGDDGRVLRWGLDLAGGKSVHIGLKDQDGKPVSNKDDLREGVNELYTRVNKMGVSEVNIRIEGSNIALDFPGAQGLSASELITASSMTLHIVNEKFGRGNSELAPTVNSFLQDVWNEAVVTNRQSVDDINEIAWRMLGGNTNEQSIVPQSEAAQILLDNGLRLAGQEDMSSNSFNDTLSSIAIWRGDDMAQWEGAANPLIIVYHNYALEGASLEGVQTQYNPNTGNALAFRVSSSYGKKHNKQGNPQDDFYAWTSQFAEGKIAGTNKEMFSGGRGWRLAIILNNKVISAPALGYPLRSSGEISGHFTQREVSQLAADLKAGALSYTPQILSEQNVSPDLGKQERSKGIYASLFGLILVVGLMVWYYRFAGLVASIAVLFNLFVMWGVLQNLGAALTLPGIAGIILTVGMAVDANVLVFERMREEFAVSSRIASAIQIGYKKAFSAIVDSNITTIIAAIILIQFDSGPIKGFAVTLIIGIVTSMFTALFMTRYFFTVWARSKKNKALTMLNLIRSVKYNFLSKSKVAMGISLVLVVLGVSFFFTQKHSLFGMDFTGGYGVTLHLERQVEGGYKQKVREALVAAGVSSQDIELRTLNQANILQLNLSTALDQEEGVFSQLPQMDTASTLESTLNPRLDWVMSALKTNGVALEENSLVQANNSWTTVSGQLSDTMRSQALIGLGVAMLCILIYLSIRFEFKYAVGAIFCLIHDVLVSIALLILLHILGVPIQIDLQVIGALMTIIGYSLNDTIIVFDRIREDVRLNKKMNFSELVNTALNKTLSRTVMTSFTTLLVLIALVCLGGSMIFDFSLVMAIGVIVGTLSSLFVAAPFLLMLHNREEKKKSLHLSPKDMKLKKA